MFCRCSKLSESDSKVLMDQGSSFRLALASQAHPLPTRVHAGHEPAFDGLLLSA